MFPWTPLRRITRHLAPAVAPPLLAEGVEDLAARLEVRVVLTVHVHGVDALHAVAVDIHHPAESISEKSITDQPELDESRFNQSERNP